MGVTHLITKGRRIVRPDDRDVHPDHVEYAIAAEEVTYDNGMRVVFTRFWSKKKWRFVIEARDVDGVVIAQTEDETFKHGRHVIETRLTGWNII